MRMTPNEMGNAAWELNHGLRILADGIYAYTQRMNEIAGRADVAESGEEELDLRAQEIVYRYALDACKESHEILLQAHRHMLEVFSGEDAERNQEDNEE